MIQEKYITNLFDRVTQLHDIAREVNTTLKSTHLADDIRKVAETLHEVLKIEKKYGK
jgi:hypothetical protein